MLAGTRASARSIPEILTVAGMPLEWRVLTHTHAFVSAFLAYIPGPEMHDRNEVNNTIVELETSADNSADKI